MAKHAYGQDGRIVSSDEFDYNQIERDLLGDDPKLELSAGQFTQEEIDRTLKVLKILLRWVWQNGSKNSDGLKIRSIVVCWLFLEELRPLSMTQLARGFGMKKQSIGRWIDAFRLYFREFKSRQIRPLPDEGPDKHQPTNK